jgi:hypothetical protein
MKSLLKPIALYLPDFTLFLPTQQKASRIQKITSLESVLFEGVNVINPTIAC